MVNSKYKVVFTDVLFKEYDIESRILQPLGVELVVKKPQGEQDLINLAKDADGLMGIYFPINQRMLEQLPRLKVISVWGVGTNHIDIEAATQKNVIVANVPDYCTDEVSTHAVALILGCARQISQYDRFLQQGEWAYGKIPLKRFAGKTVGIAGLGAIGRAVAEKLAGFNVNLIGYDAFVAKEVMQSLNVKKVDFKELLAQSDFITIHTPLTDETHHLFDAEQFRQMKNTAFIINTSRGGVINEAALVAALEKGEIAGGALDVFETEPPDRNQGPIGHPRLTLTPHIGWQSAEAMVECRVKAAESVKAVLMGKKPAYGVNR